MTKNNAAAGLTEARVKEMIAEAIQGLVNEERVIVVVGGAIEKFAEGLAARPDGLALQDALEELQQTMLTEDQVRELFSGEMEAARLAGEAQQSLPGIAELQLSFNPEWLDGLTYITSRKQKPKPGARPAHVPVERPLTASDVLSYSVGEESVTLIAGDGQKHIVKI